jgi:hypothetical protein
MRRSEEPSLGIKRTGVSHALHLDRVALLAIEQVHLLAADVSLLKKRGAHLVRRQNAKQMSWRPFGWRQIFSVVPGFQKSGHAGMDWLHEFIGGPSEDGKGPLLPVDLWVLPELPNRRHAKRLATRKYKLVLRLFSLLHVLPLEDRVGRNDTASFLE